MIESVSENADGVITVKTLTNTSLEAAENVTIQLTDDGAAYGVCEASVVAGTMNAHNTFEAPEVVTEQAFADYEKTADGIRVQIPACSVVSIRLKNNQYLDRKWSVMNQFFDYNNNVFRVLGGLADCLILGALWIVCSIPVVTMGAATAAVYHAVNKSIAHGQGYAFREYCTALKTDLKQTTGAWLLWGILAAFLAADLVVTRQFLAQGSALGALYYFFIVLSAMALAWEFYLTAYMARFEGTIRESMKKTLVMVVANLGWSALLVAVFVLFVLMCNDTQCLIVLFPGVFALVKNYVLEKVFRKYRTPEDLARELEMTREYRN